MLLSEGKPIRGHDAIQGDAGRPSFEVDQIALKRDPPRRAVIVLTMAPGGNSRPSDAASLRWPYRFAVRKIAAGQ
jgi:hypothetical protein